MEWYQKLAEVEPIPMRSMGCYVESRKLLVEYHVTRTTEAARDQYRGVVTAMAGLRGRLAAIAIA